jgi:hypothetical protein
VQQNLDLSTFEPDLAQIRIETDYCEQFHIDDVPLGQRRRDGAGCPARPGGLAQTG